MKQENYRNKRKINRLTTALLGIFFYILLVLLLKSFQNLFVPGSTAMVIFTMVEMIIVSLYLVGYTWYNFNNASLEDHKSFWKYILFIMIPITVMTLLTIIISYVGGESGFNGVWNSVTFIIAPTLFLYIPFGFIYSFMSMLPLGIFMVLCLFYMVAMQYIGYVLGAPSRKFAKEREIRRMEQDQLVMRKQDEMARQASKARAVQEEIRQKQQQHHVIVDERDPLKDIENTPVVQTEAFSIITDDMVADAERRQKIKTHQQKLEARRRKQMEIQQQEKKPENTTVLDSMPVSKQKAPDQSTRDLRQQLELARKRLAEQEEK